MNESALPMGLQRRSLAIGLFCGCALSIALAGGAYSLLARRKAAAPPPAYTVQKDAIQLVPGAPQPVPFETTQVVSGPPLPLPQVTARIAAVETRTSPCYAPLEGRIERVAVAFGDVVKPGARLALVRSSDLPTMLRELRASQSSAGTKRALVERMKILVESRGASQNELLIAQNELREAELMARAADARLKSLAIAEDGDNLYWVLASRAGTIIQMEAAPGLHVGPAKEHPLATVADLDEVLVLADVTPQDASDLRPGGPVQIHVPALATTSHGGVIESIAQVVDPDRQTVPIRIRAQNGDHRLRPNSFVEVTFAAGEQGQKPVLRVPSEAVVSDGLQSVVFVEAAPGHFRRTPVTLGRQRDGACEILSGLSAGQRVVSRGALLLLNALVLEG